MNSLSSDNFPEEKWDLHKTKSRYCVLYVPDLAKQLALVISTVNLLIVCYPLGMRLHK